MDDYNNKPTPESQILPEAETAAQTAADPMAPDQNTQNQGHPDNQEPWVQGQEPADNQGPWVQGQEPADNQEPWVQGQGPADNQGPWIQDQGQTDSQAPWQQNPNYPANPPPQNPYYPASPQDYYYGQRGPSPRGSQSWQNPQPPQAAPPVNNMAVTSMVLGIASMIISCCCFPAGFIIGFALGMGGLALSILSKKGKPFSGYAIAGLILSILGICESLFIFVCYLITAHMMQDPKNAALFNEILRQYYNGN